MSRSGYDEDIDDQWAAIMYRGAVKKAMDGARGQDFLKEMLAALDAMPEKRLIRSELEANGAVCALGAVGKARGLDMKPIDPDDAERVARAFGIAEAMAREIAYTNDDEWQVSETPEHRYERVRTWVVNHIREKPPEITRVCSRCHQELPIERFPLYIPEKGRVAGRRTYCKKCNNRRRAEDHKRNPNQRAKRAERMRRYRADPLEQTKNRARRAVREAIKRGELVKRSCETCGLPNTEAHHDDYAKPLDVRWLCPAHHKALHGRYK